ncbi:hypothetical protein GYMLUDRAFT_1027401, partial [Collybiopsis luxurians FD-317 M1]
ILGWTGFLRVDGVLYEWLGNTSDTNLDSDATVTVTTYNGFQITPTRSILSLSAGPMAINITFLSPIEPDDLFLQSFPFTYIYFEAASMDGNSHSVQVYQDITGEWTSSSTNSFIEWNTTSSNSIVYHQVGLAPPQDMTEISNMAEDGVVYHVTNAGNNVTYQTGNGPLLRDTFLGDGNLVNVQDTEFRTIFDDLPTFAFSTDLDNITSTSSPVVWGIGLVRNPDIIYTTAAGNQTRRPYFFTKYSDVPTAMSDFMSDASNALQRAIVLDDRIMSDASKISSNLTDLVSLASRQIMAGMEVTVGIGSDGQMNKFDVLIFMKDIGDSKRTNPVEVLYAALPAILYFNASWAGYLLEPLLQYQSSGLYTEDFAAEDLGNAFPSVIGNNNPTISLAMESIGDMLIMAWAHATFSGDRSLLSLYVLLHAEEMGRYAYFRPAIDADWIVSQQSPCFLSPQAVYPSRSADGLNNANMTNLAIKGIIAIRSMAEISQAVGNYDDYNNYLNQSSSLVSQWQQLAGSSGHLTSTYGASSSWGLMYNLYPDKLLGFNLVDEYVSFWPFETLESS